jgi:hypothetical protein
MSEKKTKPKYSSVENVGWMIANAWRECRSVLLICVIIAVVSVALNLTELFIAPQMNMSAAFYTRRRQCFTVAAEKFDTCGGGI